MDRKYIIGGLLGFVLGIMIIPMSSDAIEGIPPTPAWKVFNVLTSPWATNDTNVNATAYNDLIYFVSDGSITFNVTESYP